MKYFKNKSIRILSVILILSMLLTALIITSTAADEDDLCPECNVPYWSPSCPHSPPTTEPQTTTEPPITTEPQTTTQSSVKKFTITYSPNGGSGSMPTDTVEQGGDYTVRGCAFTKISVNNPNKNSVFVGWGKDVYNAVYYPGNIIKNVQSDHDKRMSK